MPVNERVMSQGSFSMQFNLESSETLWKQISEFGHIVVTPQWVDHRLFDDAAMLAMARYSGVIRKKRNPADGVMIEGVGPVMWLGDGEIGDIIETKVTLANSSLENALDNLLPPSIAKGTVTEPSATYSGEHQWETPLEAIRTVSASMGAEYRVNPNFTIDAGESQDVYNITNPTIIILRGPASGGDANYRGVDVETLISTLDASQYITRAIVTTTDSDNVTTLVGGQDRSPSTTYYDGRGNLVNRTLLLQSSGSPVEVSTYLTTQMNEHAIVQNMEISTEFTEIQNGDLRLGDAFWCYDPPAFVDTANEVWFRAQTINPVKLRLIGASWPLRPPMGVYYRPPTAAPVALDWIDLTRFMRWEQTNNKLGVRS